MNEWHKWGTTHPESGRIYWYIALEGTRNIVAPSMKIMLTYELNMWLPVTWYLRGRKFWIFSVWSLCPWSYLWLDLLRGTRLEATRTNWKDLLSITLTKRIWITWNCKLQKQCECKQRHSVYYRDRSLYISLCATYFAAPLVVGRLNYKSATKPCVVTDYFNPSYSHLC